MTDSQAERKVQVPPIPDDEEERLEELYALRVLDTASEERFDRYTRLVAEIYNFPIVWVTLVDRDRQWFKSSCGLEMDETERDISFCAHAIVQPDLLVVPDTHEDPRFAANPLVTGEPYIRFYAGATVHGPSGKALGTLCVVDREPRDFSDTQCRQLKDFAALIDQELRHTYDLDKVREQIQFSAYHDTLTGLPNRRLFENRLHTILGMCERTHRRAVVLLFNITGLRHLNQTYGSTVGDELIIQVGQRLNRQCPLGGSIARLQADEFVMVLPMTEPDDEPSSMVQPIRRQLARPYVAGGRDHYINVGIGGSVFPHHGSSGTALIERAAAAVHRASAGETGGLRLFTDSAAMDLSERLAIESGLRRALETYAFRYVFQPIVDLESGRICGVEALIRWTDAELGEVSPAKFIPIAEENGLISAIGERGLEAACDHLSRWRRTHGWELPVAINISAVQLHDVGFPAQVLAVLETCGIPPQDLWLEVTEFSLVSDVDAVSDCIEWLDDAGIRLVLDDFGTGYSSLEYIRRIPLAALKIDRSFVSGLPGNSQDASLTRAIIAMARSLGIQVIAEGVETPEQLAFLRDAGCDRVQGFLFSRPVDEDALMQLRERSLSP